MYPIHNLISHFFKISFNVSHLRLCILRGTLCTHFRSSYQTHVSILCRRSRIVIRSSRRERGFLLYYRAHTDLRPTQRPMKWATVFLSWEAKYPAHGEEYWPPTSVEIKKAWICISAHPPYVFYHVVLIKRRKIFSSTSSPHSLYISRPYSPLYFRGHFKIPPN
jgi:hypothetical protein